MLYLLTVRRENSISFNSPLGVPVARTSNPSSPGNRARILMFFNPRLGTLQSQHYSVIQPVWKQNFMFNVAACDGCCRLIRSQSAFIRKCLENIFQSFSRWNNINLDQMLTNSLDHLSIHSILLWTILGSGETVILCLNSVLPSA